MQGSGEGPGCTWVFLFKLIPGVANRKPSQRQVGPVETVAGGRFSHLGVVKQSQGTLFIANLGRMFWRCRDTFGKLSLLGLSRWF